MTHRQFEAWQEWLRQQWNKPSRTDYYLMQLTREVVRKFATNPNAIQTEQFQIPFKFKQVQAETAEEATARSKSFWRGSLRAAMKARQDGG